VVFVYGGSWQMGAKDMYAFVGKALAAKGFVAVIPDYRVYPQVRYPDFLRDNALAVRWARDNAARYGGDPDRLFLMGHSAGAYDVAMLTLDRRWLAEVGMDPARDIRATVALAGPYDFLPLHDPVLKTIFGPEKTLLQTQPITYADGAGPPMLLLAGAGDKTVDPGNSLRLGALIRARGGEAEVKIYKRIGHAQIVGSIAAPLRFLAPTLADATAFMAEHDQTGGDQQP
jgi:acetyl esterase/lipase